MATSLSKIKDKIKKLQQQAASLQSTVIARIKREIAQHGLDIEDLFGSRDAAAPAKARVAQPKKAAGARKTGADKPAKFADEQGNTWHGVGKRPQWIHDALAAGRTLDELLVGKKKAAVKTAKKAAPAKKAAAPAAAKKAKAAAPAKKAAAKVAGKAAAKKKVQKAPARKKAAARPESAPPSSPAEAA